MATSSLITPKALMAFADQLRENGCVVNHNKLSCTMDAHDDGTVVLMAIQKGPWGSPWIATFYDSPRIKWTGLKQEVEDK